MSDRDYIDVALDINSDKAFKSGATRIIQRIRPHWQKIGFQNFNDGITNKLIGAYDEQDEKEEVVLIRGYGYKSDLLIDRRLEIRNMQVLHKNGMGSELYASFRNGIVYQFLKGSTLTVDTVSSPEVFPAVARLMRELHAVQLEDNADQSPCLWRLLRKFHAASPDGFPENPDKDVKYKKYVFTKTQLFEEIEKMESALKTDADTVSRVTFCHNDALLGNIISSDDGQKLSFIDYEYGDMNYREYDIANHFCEYVGIGDEKTGFLDYDKHYPTKDFQLEWIGAYLGSDGTKEIARGDNDAKEIARVQHLVDRFSPLPNLVWGIWALVQSKHSNIEFDFLDYAIQRLNFYKKRAHLAGLTT